MTARISTYSAGQVTYGPRAYGAQRMMSSAFERPHRQD
jgi:hypothetical protein